MRDSPAIYFMFINGGTIEKGLKMPQESFRLDIKKNFFIESIVKHSNKLLKEVTISGGL